MKTTTKTLTTVEINCDNVDIKVSNDGLNDVYSLSAYERESGYTLIINIEANNMRALINELYINGYKF